MDNRVEKQEVEHENDQGKLPHLNSDCSNGDIASKISSGDENHDEALVETIHEDVKDLLPNMGKTDSEDVVSSENTKNETQASEMRKEIGPFFLVNSLGALYKFSWKIFHEPSYTDVVSLKLIQNSRDDISEESLRANVISEVSKIFQKSVQEKNVEFQTLVKDLNEIKVHYPHDIPTKASAYKFKFFYDQEISGKDHVSSATPKSSESYEKIEKFFKTASVVIDEAQAVRSSPDVEQKRQQHKLLMLALLSETTISSSMYRVGGSTNPTQWMYKKIHFIGDSQVRNLYNVEAWIGCELTRPHFHCKDDLSLFSLKDAIKEIIPKVSVKGRMLVICSVGMRDVVRSIGALGIFVTLENTLSDMKKIQDDFKSFYGAENDLLFADVLPVDICKLLELHKEAVLVKETEKLISECNETTLQLVKFSYLLSKNMLMEDLSRFRYLPAWEIFVNPVDLAFENSRVKLTSLSEGIQLDLEKFPHIAHRIRYLHECYCELFEPPTFNTIERQVYFVCNEKFSAIDKFWPKKKLNEKPVFIFLKEVRSSTIEEHLKPHFPLHEKDVLVVWFDAGELFQPCTVNDCTCKPTTLRLDLPRFVTPVQLYDSLILKRKDLEQLSGSPNVLLTTLCPINFADHLKGQLTDHGDACQVFKAPPDCFLAKVNEYLLSVTDAVNLRLVQSNRMRGLGAWDVCSFLYQRNQDGSLAFMPPVSPCDRGPLKPQTAAKIMICLSEFRQKTVKHLNWVAFCRSHSRKRTKKKERYGNKLNFEVESRLGQSPVRAASETRRGSTPDSAIRAVSLGRFPGRYASADTCEQFVTNPQVFQAAKKNSTPSTSNTVDALSYHQKHQWYHTDSTKDSLEYQASSKHSGYLPPHPRYQPEVDFHNRVSGFDTGCPQPDRLRVATPSRDTADLMAVGPRGVSGMATPYEPHQKRMCYGVESNSSVSSLERPASRSSCSFSRAATDVGNDGAKFSKLDENALKKLVESLRNAHENEIAKLRANPKSHSKYEQQRKEFIEHALQMCDDHKQPFEMDSIERVWQEYWRVKLEMSFVNTWKKRVAHLVRLMCRDKPLHPETKEMLSRLTNVEEPPEISEDCEMFTSSEAKLLNKLRKRKRNFSDGEDIQEVQDTHNVSGVALGKKMLAQVQKSWKSIGCKTSQEMLRSAINKIDSFTQNAKISHQEQEQYENLRISMISFIAHLHRKEGNPFDLDFKSLSEITNDFSDAERMDYILDVLKSKGITDPAKEDVDVYINALKPNAVSLTNFVAGPVLNS